MFKRILIANRGEIAIRIMRAARELGVETVSVYHNVDKNSPYVHYADYAYEIFSETPKAAYLDIQQKKAAARLFIRDTASSLKTQRSAKPVKMPALNLSDLSLMPLMLWVIKPKHASLCPLPVCRLSPGQKNRFKILTNY